MVTSPSTSHPQTNTHMNTCKHGQSSAVGAHHLSPRAQAEGRQIVRAVFLQVPLLQTHSHTITITHTHIETICPLTYCSHSIPCVCWEGGFSVFISEEFNVIHCSSTLGNTIVSLRSCVICAINVQEPEHQLLTLVLHTFVSLWDLFHGQ